MQKIRANVAVVLSPCESTGGDIRDSDGADDWNFNW